MGCGNSDAYPTAQPKGSTTPAQMLQQDHLKISNPYTESLPSLPLQNSNPPTQAQNTSQNKTPSKFHFHSHKPQSPPTLTTQFSSKSSSYFPYIKSEPVSLNPPKFQLSQSKFY
ncbi:unnamed protein product [Moneuplotes crassus]|uniref:Uncharacterized protein n=1 Tax=Euplotes crassus TaxID=5936 RepID=A0AAD1XXR3_EUPCR|nr:unnamed protein product [Moneuplotes crassus]